MKNRTDINGKVYGRLTVISTTFYPETGAKATCLVRCVCGVEKVVSKNFLIGYPERNKSCGCSRIKDPHMAHRIPLYKIWMGMKYRCSEQGRKTQPKSKHYKNVSVCERWLDFNNFHADMSPTYAKGLTLERKDVLGNYEPENCTWITWEDQQKNKTNTVYVDFMGCKIRLKNLCEVLELDYNLMWGRIIRRKKNPEEAVQAALITKYLNN